MFNLDFSSISFSQSSIFVACIFSLQLSWLLQKLYKKIIQGWRPVNESRVWAPYKRFKEIIIKQSLHNLFFFVLIWQHVFELADGLHVLLRKKHRVNCMSVILVELVDTVIYMYDIKILLIRYGIIFLR